MSIKQSVSVGANAPWLDDPKKKVRSKKGWEAVVEYLKFHREKPVVFVGYGLATKELIKLIETIELSNNSRIAISVPYQSSVGVIYYEDEND